eukprot:CAMPEP_0194343958 /NCGR_PEP_ID=MMETSP0171-20130528/99363_1 /TAXON_ID=218684 /ORGANISM="Corethron pennatum, Strain L29A3" /LENGTH=35 /DNA_ID= /DNA_START= /DNA_END= /DNA_ORIENTATION=
MTRNRIAVFIKSIIGGRVIPIQEMNRNYISEMVEG